MSHRDAPPETPVQQSVREFYTARWQGAGKGCGWGRDKHGQFFSEFARDAEAAWSAAIGSALNPRQLCANTHGDSNGTEA